MRCQIPLHDLFDLPVLKIDRGPPTKKVDDGHELILLAPADHGPFNSGERTRGDPDPGPNRHGRLRLDGKARVQHGLNLSEISLDRRLIANLENLDQSIAPECRQPILGVAVKKEIALEERDDRANLPPLGGAIFLNNLRQIKRELQPSKFARGRLFLARFGVQTPPHPIGFPSCQGCRVIPEIRWVEFGLGRQDRHALTLVVARACLALNKNRDGRDERALYETCR